MSLSAYQVKAAALCYFRFKRQMPYVCTEVGRFSADVLALDEKRMIEAEVKVSVSDLRNEFTGKSHTKVFKHKMFENPTSYYKKWVPNEYYVALPDDEKILRAAETYVPSKYGLLIIDGLLKFGSEVHIHRRAKKLHDSKPSIVAQRQMVKRMSSEICNWHITECFEPLIHKTLRKVDEYRLSEREKKRNKK